MGRNFHGAVNQCVLISISELCATVGEKSFIRGYIPLHASNSVATGNIVSLVLAGLLFFVSYWRSLRVPLTLSEELPQTQVIDVWVTVGSCTVLV